MFDRTIKRIKTKDIGQKGFTLVELILILVLVGILWIFAAPRLIGQKTVETRTFFDHAREMVRYAQKLAIAQNRPVYVRFQSATIALCYDAACTTTPTDNRVLAPSGQNGGASGCGTTWYCEGPSSTSGVTYTAASPSTNYMTAGDATFFFNALGEPYNTGDTPPTSSFTQNLTVTITGDSTSSSFVIERETGYVH